MRVITVGGKLALLAGFAVLSLASANSITYFYGYSSPGLSAWQSGDAFAAQNVQFVPQVQMVSSAMPTAWNVSYGNLASSNSYTGVNTANDSIYGGWSYSSSSFGATAPQWNTPSYNLGGFYGSNAAATGQSASSGGGFFAANTTYVNVNGFSSWNAWSQPALSQPDPIQMVNWQPIRDSLFAPVSGNFTSPTVLPDIIPPSTPLNDIGALHSPEPASVGLMAAGVLSLLYLRRRRR